MSTSTLQLLPTTATEIAQLDPAALASIPGVAYDLKRLKVYSSCLRCRAKKVKCDRKEPCSRCEKHNVECSYRELASVQLDIRQFQRHLNNPKIRKDGAGIITSTATPIITLPSGDTAVLSPSTTAAATLIAAVKATAQSSTNFTGSDNSTKRTHTDRKLAKSPATSTSASTPTSPIEVTGFDSNSSTDTESDTPTRARPGKSAAMARAKVTKLPRRKLASSASSMAAKKILLEPHAQPQNEEENDDDDEEEEEEIERLVLRDDNDPGPYYSYTQTQTDVHMSSESETEDANADVPIWRARAVGKHKQTVHEQAMAETFGLAAYLKAKEMESGLAGQTIDYELELERALAKRLPTSFSRPDRSLSRARKYAQAGYNPSLPYSRPSYCQLSASSATAHLPPAAHCCCQIAAKQGLAPGTCYFGNVRRESTVYEESSMSPPPQSINYEKGETTRIAYSPSYQPSYTPKDEPAAITATTSTTVKKEWFAAPSVRKLDISAACSASSSPLSSPRVELAPIYLPKLPAHHPNTPSSSDLSRFQIGREGDKDKPPMEIACKYNEPNVDAWDMIEQPLSRPPSIPTTKRRSVKMEVDWILS
ncbi:hypothetical protein BX616_004313 [Lobosporangium transversale]|uniref:Zn(2)-C6 fungal-type domain-containing protein n=1 Tax=Lobosporangium transversale TaxID=64571 RepID=A0A1Y2GED2_9FUNG|nr:hypothetical protein BCR41DRAFT_361939 [Lobosporangium transversale]KAF9898232.1 hypothetical protein BX616_004313 [Lobosporangium transversale]ORZ05359.1 hypothetical protein BCR41DRAFT_361939 [Lobosporangium transversale]|eukprot:XP_021877051.1 hypothetical protein BCR41DRAFT_361939 [Lobosporangium transversale]